VSVGHVREPCKTVEPIEMPIEGGGANSCGPKEPCATWSRDPQQEEEILRIDRLIEKHWESVLKCTQQKGSFYGQQRHAAKLII